MTDDVGFFIAFPGYGTGSDVVIQPPPIVTVPLPVGTPISPVYESGPVQTGLKPVRALTVDATDTFDRAN